VFLCYSLKGKRKTIKKRRRRRKRKKGKKEIN
jgi:hypothetical protein